MKYHVKCGKEVNDTKDESELKLGLEQSHARSHDDRVLDYRH